MWMVSRAASYSVRDFSCSSFVLEYAINGMAAGARDGANDKSSAFGALVI